MSKTNKNVYDDNRKAYSSVLESAASNTRGWKLATFIMGAITLTAVVGVIIIGSQSKIKPVVIEIDGYGTPMRLYQINEATNTSDSRIAKATIAQTITAIRSVSVDAGMQKRRMDNIIHFFEKSQPGFNRVQEYVTNPKTNPFKRAKTELVAIQVHSVIKLTDVTWQVEWTERIRDRTGLPLDKNKYKATVTIGYADEISDETIYINPTGLLIKDLVWSKQIN